MRRAAMLVLLVLLAVAVAFAQNPTNANPTVPANNQPSGGTNSTSPTQEIQTSNGQATQGQGQNNQVPSTTGQANQIPNNQSAGEGTNNNQFPAATGNQPSAPANPMPSSTNNPSDSNATSNPNPGTPQENTRPNGSFGQRQVAPSGVGQSQVSAGTEIHATLDTPLSTKTSKPGDRFTATVAQPVRGNNGVVIPTGARIEGEVSESEEGKAVAALRGKGKLNLRFRDVVLPNGQSLPLTATLVSVHSTNGKDSKSADQEGQVESGTRGRDVAKDVGIGAGIGTIAGLIFGGPLKGLAIGAMAGGGYVLATKGKEVNLPAQTGMILKLDQPLVANGDFSQMRR
jgi:hypothetical protein